MYNPCMQLYVFALAGLALAYIFGISDVESQRWYSLAMATLLAIGLYGSTYGISIREARQNLRLILTAVTVGVVVKALLIGAVMSFVLRSPFGFVLGIMVAQIDPLSTAALQKSKHLSHRAKTILAAWSSFDDPVTVILSLYVPVAVAALSGNEWQAIGGTMQDAGIGSYLRETSLNLLFAAMVFVIWRFIRRHADSARYLVLFLAAVAMYVLFAASMSTAIYFFWMLGVAVIGLYMRPPIQKGIDHAVEWALAIAALLLGVLAVGGISWRVGAVLGISTFGSQILVGYILARKLPPGDRIRIALAQQNGITAIILALLFEPYYPNVIATIAPAIITVNFLHAISNRVISMRSGDPLTVDRQKLRLRLHMRKIRD